MQKNVSKPLIAIKRLLKLVLLLCIALPIAAGVFYTQYLKPNKDEQWVYNLPLASFNIPISPPKAAWLVSSPYIGPRLHGIEKSSSLGLLKLQWDGTQNQLSINCNPCQIQHPAISASRIDFKEIKITAQRHKTKETPQGLIGQIVITNTNDATETLEWHAQVSSATPTDLYVSGQPHIAFIYALFKPIVKNLPAMQVAGTLNMQAHLKLASLQLNVEQLELQNVFIKDLIIALPPLNTGCVQTTALPMNHWMVRAVLAAEDQRFEQHKGYDLIEIKRALNIALTQTQTIRGASTITQQLAKLIYTGREKNLERKLRELLYAIEIEKSFSKEQIINMYINHAPWGVDDQGQLICGVQAAAKYFFKIDAQDLQPKQAVWLAAMLHAPVKETRNWEKTGKINLNRAIWVAGNVRNAPQSTPEERATLIQALKDDPSLGINVFSIPSTISSTPSPSP